MFRHLGKSFAVALISLATATHAQTPPVEGRAVDPELARGHAVALGPGPLVTFLTTTGGNPHRCLLHIANAHGDEPAKVFWDNCGNAITIARLDQHHILIASYGEPYALIVVDTRTGANRVLTDGCAGNFVAVHGDNVLYLGDNRWDRGDNHLYSRPWRAHGEARKLAKPTFQRVPIVSGNLAIALTDNERQVWSVSLVSGKSRKLLELPDKAMGVRLALSPGGQRLAVAAAVMGRGHLTAIDLGSSKRLRHWQGINIDVSMLSSSLPTLEVNWVDLEHLVTSETIGGALKGSNFAWVTRALATGKVTEEITYAPMQLYHRKPPGKPVANAPPAAFSIATKGKRRMLLQAGRTEPLQSLQASDRIKLSPDRQFAIVPHERNPSVRLLYRPGKPALALFDGGGSKILWLPSMPPVERR